MSLSVSQRMHFAEMLRRNRDACVLTLSVANDDVAMRTRRDAARGLDAVLLDEAGERLVAIAEAQSVMHTQPELFGMCEECGEAITTARLDVAPWTTRCAKHAHTYEAELPVC